MSKNCSHCKKLNKNSNHNIFDCVLLNSTTCFNCKKTGHTPKYCLEPKKICLLCQHLGHLSSDCGFLSQILTSEFKSFTEKTYQLPPNVKRISFFDLCTLQTLE